MNRSTAILIREVKANRFDPITLRNSRVAVRASTFAIFLFGSLSMACFGGGLAIAGILYAAGTIAAGILFAVNLYARNRQEKLKAESELAAVEAKRADAEGARIIAAAFAADFQAAFARQEFSDLIDALCAVERSEKKPKRRRAPKQQLRKAA